MLVPDFVEYTLTFALLALSISAPGAQTSTQLPKLLDLVGPVQRASCNVVAPTVMADVADAGECKHASLLEFPAAATTTMPEAIALSTRKLKTW